MTDSAIVRDQYSDDEKLAIRQRLHTKYSTARGSLFDWLFEQYRFDAPCRRAACWCCPIFHAVWSNWWAKNFARHSRYWPRSWISNTFPLPTTVLMW